MVIDNNIKIKHFYRFIEFISKLLGKKLPHERFKLISTDNYKAESKNELEIKKIADSYAYLLNNINQSLTTNIIKNSYYILTEKLLEDEIVQNILKVFYQNYDEGPHFLAALIHFAVLENIKENKIEFAFMLSNLIMYKKKRKPFIPFEVMYDSYFKAIREKDINLKAEDILKTIKEIKEILKAKYKVKKLYLYGSFAKEMTNINSDLDFLIIYEDNIFNFERLRLNEKLREYLANKLQIHIDLIDFTHALTQLDICEMENIITLI